VTRRFPSAGLVLCAALLVGLRLAVTVTGGAGFTWSEIAFAARDSRGVLVSIAQGFVYSLCFELVALVALAALSRAGAAGRWAARAGVFALLGLNVAGTLVFFVLRSYAKGFQLVGMTMRELGGAMGSHVGPGALALFGAAAAAALLFARDGSVERRRPALRTAVLAGALALAAAGGVARLLANPTGFPSVAHSPLTLLLVRALPARAGSAPGGVPAPEDWAPAAALAPRWSALGAAARRFNVVVVVLESVRADVFYPSPAAPPLPHVASLARRGVAFTRAYAHEPLSVKSLEAMLFGIYPILSWDSLSAKEGAIALDSVPERWRALGMATAFLQNADLMVARQRSLLDREHFDRVADERDLERLDAGGDDRALVSELDAFLGPVPARFGAFLWVRRTHMPYELPKALGNTHRLNSFEAYRDAVAYEDAVVGDLDALLERRGVRDDTVVVLVGDHGESFGEHPDAGFAHGSGVYEGSSHVPLLVTNARLFHGETDDRVVELKDLAPTLAWLAGDARPTLNVGSCLFFEKPSESAYLVNNLDESSFRGGVVRGALKYQAWSALGGAGDDRLYDVVADPGETRNLWTERPAEGRALKARYFGWLNTWNERWSEIETRDLYGDRAALERVLLAR